MATFVWTPAGPNPASLGSVAVGSPVNFNISGLYTPDTTDIITACSAVWVPYGGFDLGLNLTLTPSFTDTTCAVAITGTAPIDYFDQYSATYVDQGESNTTQTPVVSILSAVPDFKEVYSIAIDGRTSIVLSCTVTTTVTDGGVFVADYIETFDFTVTQTYDMIKTWTDTYFSTRY